VKRNVANLAASALQNFLWIAEVGAAIEAEVHVFGVDRYVAVALFQPAGEGVADCDGIVSVVDGFGCAGFEGEEIGSDFESEFLDGWVVRR
jgi:hypothetical protein